MSHQYLPPELPLCNITSLTDFLCNNWVAEKGMYLWSNIFGNWNCKLLINLHQQTSAHQSDIFMWAIIRFSSSTDNLTTTTFEMWLGHLAQWLRCRSHSRWEYLGLISTVLPIPSSANSYLRGSSWRPSCLGHLIGDSDWVPCSWLWLGPFLAVSGTWGMRQCAWKVYLCLPLCFSNKIQVT